MEKIEKRYSQDWFSSNIPYWERYLKQYAGVSDIKFLEIGVFEGRSSCYLLENILTGANTELYSIDLFEYEGQFKRPGFEDLYEIYKHNVSEHADRVKLFKGYSHEMLKHPDVQANKYRFIYVDACHETKEVLEDTLLAFPLLDEGGIMIFDDYLGGAGVKPAVDQFLREYADQIKLLWSGYQVFIQKVTK